MKKVLISVCIFFCLDKVCCTDQYPVESKYEKLYTAYGNWYQNMNDTELANEIRGYSLNDLTKAANQYQKIYKRSTGYLRDTLQRLFNQNLKEQAQASYTKAREQVGKASSNLKTHVTTKNDETRAAIDNSHKSLHDLFTKSFTQTKNQASEHLKQILAELQAMLDNLDAQFKDLDSNLKIQSNHIGEDMNKNFFALTDLLRVQMRDSTTNTNQNFTNQTTNLSSFVNKKFTDQTSDLSKLISKNFTNQTNDLKNDSSQRIKDLITELESFANKTSSAQTVDFTNKLNNQTNDLKNDSFTKITNAKDLVMTRLEAFQNANTLEHQNQSIDVKADTAQKLKELRESINQTLINQINVLKEDSAQKLAMQTLDLKEDITTKFTIHTQDVKTSINQQGNATGTQISNFESHINSKLSELKSQVDQVDKRTDQIVTALGAVNDGMGNVGDQVNSGLSIRLSSMDEKLKNLTESSETIKKQQDTSTQSIIEQINTLKDQINALHNQLTEDK